MYKKISRVLVTIVISMLLVVQPVLAQGGQPPKYDYTITGPNGEIYYVDVFEVVGKSNFPAKVLKANEALAAGGCKSITYGVNIANGAGGLLRVHAKVVRESEPGVG